MVKRKNPTLL